MLHNVDIKQFCKTNKSNHCILHCAQKNGYATITKTKICIILKQRTVKFRLADEASIL